MVLDADTAEMLTQRLRDWPMPPGESVPIMMTVHDTQSAQNLLPDDVTAWMLYRATMAMVAGASIDADQTDLHLGWIVRRGMRRVRAGDVPLEDFVRAYGAALASCRG